MKCLEFERSGVVLENQVVRRACFQERSLLPLSAACMVANGIREMLASALQTRVDARVFPPVIPKRTAWNVFLHGTLALRACGNIGEAAIFVRPSDARALACAVFGEPPSDRPVLSAIEREVVQRLLHRLASTLTSVCGSPLETAITLFEHLSGSTPYMTYFEVVIQAPIAASIGIALAHDPVPQPCGSLALEDLQNLELPLRGHMRTGKLPASRACALRPGDVLPLDNEVHAELRLRERTIARGTCGARDNRYAFTIRETAA